MNTREPMPISSAEVARLLASDAGAAEARARAILHAQPQNADALLVLGAALRRQGRAAEARTILDPIVASQPDSALAQMELGLVFVQIGNPAAAVEALARAVDVSSTFVDAWCALSDQLALLESVPDRRSTCQEAEDSLRAGAEAITRKNLVEAESLLARCLERSPGFQAARFRYAIVLLAQQRAHLALPVIEELVGRDTASPFYRELRASAFYELGAFREAIAQYEELLGDDRERPGAWISYGRALRAIGREEDCVAAFMRAVDIFPAFAQGYRTLATVKTFRFAPETIPHLRTLLARPGLLISTRSQLHFALAKALDDAGEYAEAFEQYSKSQVLQGTGAEGTGERFHDFVRRLKAVFTPAFFRARASSGCTEKGPIFVVGMLRAGSTLVQEILAAHSMIERTGELQDLNTTVNCLREERRTEAGVQTFPELLTMVAPERFAALGAQYLERTQPRRKSDRPFFVDKFPGNFVYAGLIHLILPHARIIDVRRDPLDCCVSCFTNYFPEGPVWSHSLDDLGRFYAGYVELMAHFDEVLPGRVHRVFYEQLVDDPEGEVRRLLDYLGLPFEPGCLRFYEREQAIRTTSVEQARRPIYRDGIGNSHKYAPWLTPLSKALGSVLDAYPDVPKFYPRVQASMTMRIA